MESTIEQFVWYDIINVIEFRSLQTYVGRRLFYF